MKSALFNRTASLALLLLALISSSKAGTPVFTYTSRDMMLVFRKTGADGGATSPNTLEINIGQASLFYGATAGSTVTIGQLATGKLNSIFGNMNDLSWSVGACVPAAGDSGDPTIPVKTLWVTDPRVDPNTPATPWVRYSGTSQGGTASQIKSILDNAVFYSGTVTNSSSNTTSLIIIPVGNGHDAGAFLGSVSVGSWYADYKDTFGQGSVENTTPSTFTTDGQPSRCDLYELRPDTTATQPPGKYLGYFELRTNGTIVFVAASVAIPAPTLTITMSGNSRMISFQSAASANYTLFYTDASGLTTPMSTWSTVVTNILGDGTVKAFQDSGAGLNRFYRIGAH